MAAGARRRRASATAKCCLSPCAVWLLAFLLHELPDGRVALRGLPQFPLPQTCMSRALLGLRCPGCGLTRSIIHLAQGDWRESWHDHRLGGLLGIVIALQIPYRLYLPSQTRTTVAALELAGCDGICADWSSLGRTGYWMWRRGG